MHTPDLIQDLDAERPHILISGDRMLVTSTDLVKHFGKAHKDVLKAIQNVDCSDEFRGRNFAPSSYITQQNKVQPSCDLTRDGFTFLVMGFTGPRVAAWKERYIAAFNAMEASLRRTPAPAESYPAAPGVPLAKYLALLERNNELLEARLAQVERPKRPAPRPLSAEEQAQVLRYAAAGLGPADIAARTGRSSSAVRNVLRANRGEVAA
jgi:Rha family phage regulatory protein